MPPILAVNVIHLYSITDIVGQVIVAGLGIVSLVAWTIMFGKFFELRRLRELNHAYERSLRGESGLLNLGESYRSRRTIPYGDLFADAVEAYWRAASIGKERGSDTSRFRLEHTENALQRALARQILRYESSMIFLASIVSGAPFLGLLGTVWGVLVAFDGVAGETSTNIQTLAPGVSAALMTTTAGLLVAIPSVFGYNILLASTKQLITELENYASSLADRIELESE